MKTCVECGHPLSENDEVCQNCGCPVNDSEDAEKLTLVSSKPTIEKKDDADGKSTANTGIRAVLILAMIIFFILAGTNFHKASDVKNNYYYSENYTSLNKNAYVGGDAYNYIINGTYFTGYCVKGSGFMISGVVCGVGVSIIGANKKERENGVD